MVISSLQAPSKKERHTATASTPPSAAVHSLCLEPLALSSAYTPIPGGTGYRIAEPLYFTAMFADALAGWAVGSLDNPEMDALLEERMSLLGQVRCVRKGNFPYRIVYRAKPLAAGA